LDLANLAIPYSLRLHYVTDLLSLKSERLFVHLREVDSSNIAERTSNVESIYSCLDPLYSSALVDRFLSLHSAQ